MEVGVRHTWLSETGMPGGGSRCVAWAASELVKGGKRANRFRARGYHSTSIAVSVAGRDQFRGALSIALF